VSGEERIGVRSLRQNGADLTARRLAHDGGSLCRVRGQARGVRSSLLQWGLFLDCVITLDSSKGRNHFNAA
jgi:hypothetical protein